MLKEIIENVHVKDRNKLNQYQHRHFHPSGETTPTKEDIEVTKRIKEAGKLMGINLLDHIIIGYNSHCSLKEYRII